MSDILDKLAMEVSEWSEAGFYEADMKNEDYELLNECQMEMDWEQRRKELINEPDDSYAPKWANWKAQDGDGEWRWFSECPFEDGKYSWWSVEGEGKWACVGAIPAGHDWRRTLTTVNHSDVTLEDLLRPLTKPDEEMGVESGESFAECIVLIQEIVYILNSCDDEFACNSLNRKIGELLDRI